MAHEEFVLPPLLTPHTSFSSSRRCSHASHGSPTCSWNSHAPLSFNNNKIMFIFVVLPLLIKNIFFLHTKTGLLYSGTFNPIIKTNDLHYFSYLFWYRTLHVSDKFTAHHQESSTAYTAIRICLTGYGDCLLASSYHNLCVLVCVLY